MEEKTFEYAGVYLLDSPYFLDGMYDYFIPLEMRGDVFQGRFLTVPFGKSNRRQMAIVRELHHSPAYSDIKPIEAVCFDRPPLSREMLELCDYMKEHCLCTFGEAVRCTTPSSVLGKMTEFYYPLQGVGPNASTGFDASDLFIYDYLLSTGGKTLDALKMRFGAAAATEATKKLFSRGMIGRELMTGKTATEAFEYRYALSVSGEECEKMLSGTSSVKLRSLKHKAILAYLLEKGEPACANELAEKLEVSAAQIKALSEKGLIECQQVRVWRGGVDEKTPDKSEILLNEEQSAAFDEIKTHIESGKASAILLHGVTGSGKTSVIIRAIDESLERGQGVIMLLPEIALTPQTLKIFSSRYGKRIALVHSGLSAGERFDSFMRIREGEADLVVGTRSAIFSPVKNLGLIIMDEEHETTYKSETSPKYHARDIARWRCVHNNATLLLSSATPSIESYTKAMDGKYTLLKLRNRFGGAELPDVKIYDMRNELRSGNQSPLGALLKEELNAVTERGEQVILFLNRRGYNTSVSCKSCGELITCPHCSISLNYHTKRGGYDKGFLFCHWCGYRAPMPEKCPTCSSEHLARIGFGTQKIEEEIGALLPDKKILRMDADSTSAKNSMDELLSEFKNGDADVLLGTQMVTKGHDFPGVTLVGVLLADMSLYMDDYHANERTFSMLTQVIGRAGRSEKKGMAIIQTNNPDNDTIRLACRQDYEAFYASEIRLRKLLTFPPYCDIALLTITSADEKQALIGATVLRQEIDKQIAVDFRDVQMIIYGPFESPVYKVEGKYRMRIVIKCRLNQRSRKLFASLLEDFGRNSKGKTALSIDFNPTGL